MEYPMKPLDAVGDAEQWLLAGGREIIVRSSQRFDIEAKARCWRPELVSQRS
jgi:hypothetical protein